MSNAPQHYRNWNSASAQWSTQRGLINNVSGPIYRTIFIRATNGLSTRTDRWRMVQRPTIKDNCVTTRAKN